MLIYISIPTILMHRTGPAGALIVTEEMFEMGIS